MSRLGRDLKRTLLVDDTPLAFFRQPDNGIPVLQFRCAAGALRCAVWLHSCGWASLIGRFVYIKMATELE